MIGKEEDIKSRKGKDHVGALWWKTAGGAQSCSPEDAGSGCEEAGLRAGRGRGAAARGVLREEAPEQAAAAQQLLQGRDRRCQLSARLIWLSFITNRARLCFCSLQHPVRHSEQDLPWPCMSPHNTQMTCMPWTLGSFWLQEDKT